MSRTETLPLGPMILQHFLNYPISNAHSQGEIDLLEYNRTGFERATTSFITGKAFQKLLILRECKL